MIRAFAAVTNTNSIVTWGHVDYGGDSSSVDLTNVDSIYSTDKAFAALKDVQDGSGSVVVWGDASYGGTASSGLTNVTKIYSTSGAFAAVIDASYVVTFGYDYKNDNSNQLQFKNNVPIDDVFFNDIKEIYSTEKAFAALKNDDSVVTWGDDDTGGNSSLNTVNYFLKTGVKQVSSTEKAFAAITSKKEVITFGYDYDAQ